MGLASAKRETEATATSSVAQVDTRTSPDAVAPFAGAYTPTPGGVVPGVDAVTASPVLEAGDQFGIPLAAFRANQDRPSGVSLVTVIISSVPVRPVAAVV